MSVDLYVDTVVARARLVIVRCSAASTIGATASSGSPTSAARNGIALAALPGDERADAGLDALSTVEPPALGAARTLLPRGRGRQSRQRACASRARCSAATIAWQPPVRGRPDHGAGRCRATSGRAALVVFYRANLMAADYEPVTALMAALEREGLAPLARRREQPQGSSDRPRSSRSLIERRRPAVILNTTAFSAMREDDTTVLDAADVPVLQVVAVRQRARGMERVRPRPVAGRPRHERRAAGARRPAADARDLVQGRSADRSAPGIRQRPPPVRAGSRRLRRAPRGGVGEARDASRPAERQLALMLCDYPRARRPHRLCRRPRHDGERARNPAAAEG